MISRIWSKFSLIKKNKKDFIIISTGGTGGHVFPAQAIAEELIKKKYNLFLIIDKRGEKFLREIFLNIPSITIDITFLNKKWYKVFKLISLLFNSLKIIKKFFFTKPKLVITFGGYTTFPAAFYAILFRIPLILHEQNSVLGQTNRIFLPFAKNLFISFPNTHKVGDKYKNKVVLTGLPVRFSRSTMTKENSEFIRLLVLGGSQGATIFGKILPLAIKNLDISKQKNLQIIQQVREENIKEVLDLYSQTKCQYRVASFFDDIEYCYNTSDLVISRSGASSVFELMIFNKPAVLIPYSKAKNNHQYYNAVFLEKNFGAVVIGEEEFSVTWLSLFFHKVINDRTELIRMESNYYNIRSPQYILNSVKLFIDAL